MEDFKLLLKIQLESSLWLVYPEKNVGHPWLQSPNCCTVLRVASNAL